MDDDEVMLTVRVTAAERALLRRLARVHHSDVSEVAADGLLDVVPALHGEAGARELLRAVARPAPCAVTLWLPAPVADLLPLLGARVAGVTGLPMASASVALAAALRLWLAQDPHRLVASLALLHGDRCAGQVAARQAARQAERRTVHQAVRAAA